MKASPACSKKVLFIWLLGIGITLTLISYQILWRYSTDILLLDSHTACNIPVINPHSKPAKILIEIHGRFDGAPPCLGAIVRFSIDYEHFSIIKHDPESSYWVSLDCCYTVFKFDSGKLTNGEECFPITKEVTLLPYEHQNLDIKCKDKLSNNILYRDQLPVFRTIPSVEAEVDEISSKSSSERFSVLILGLDSVSHQNFVRYMPKTYSLLTQNLSAVEFFGFNKVGSGTIANVMAMLSGCKVLNILDPPYKVEDHCELVWKYYNENGFRTVHFEDSGFNENSLYPSIRKKRPGIGTHYNISSFMSGVRKIDHDEMGDSFEDGFGCFDNQFVMDVFEDPIVEVAKQFLNKPYFNFVWFGKTGHAVMTNTKYMDEPIHRILKRLEDLKALEETIVIIMSDHGPWNGMYLSTEAGAFERLMPTLFIAFPNSFKKNYAQAFQNIMSNTKRLTSQYDFHEMLLDLSNLSRVTDTALLDRNIKENDHQLGQSLFLPVPLDRSCETANIPAEYCMCHTRSIISYPDSVIEVQQVVAYAIIHMNSELQNFPMCAPLKLKFILKAYRRYDQFKKNVDGDYEDDLIEALFTTLPSDAEFQVIAALKPKLSLIGGGVLRTNIYKGQSDCIASWKNATYAKTMCLCI